MKLWLLSQNTNSGYDTYDSAVVAAETEQDARTIHPSGYDYDPKRDEWYRLRYGYEKVYDVSGSSGGSDWAPNPGSVTAEYLGEAKEGTEKGLILASFNAE